MNRTSCQAPQEETVDRAAGKIAALGARTHARQLVEHPGDLGRGEIWIEQEASSLANQILGAFGLQARALIGGSPVLPDDRPVDRLTGRAVPQHDCLALVGDPNSRYAFRLDRGQRFARNRKRIRPDLIRIMLDGSRAAG